MQSCKINFYLHLRNLTVWARLLQSFSIPSQSHFIPIMQIPPERRLSRLTVWTTRVRSQSQVLLLGSLSLSWWWGWSLLFSWRWGWSLSQLQLLWGLLWQLWSSDTWWHQFDDQFDIKDKLTIFGFAGFVPLLLLPPLLRLRPRTFRSMISPIKYIYDNHFITQVD